MRELSLAGKRTSISAAFGALVFLLGAAPASAETRSFVVSWSSQATNSDQTDCGPGGPNPGVQIQYQKSLADLGYTPKQIEDLVKKSQAGQGPNEMFDILRNRGRLEGKPVSPYIYPATTVDPKWKAITGKYAFGFNKRDGYILQSGGGHSLRRGQPQRPAVGRDIGTNALCDADCARVWHPYLAPADAIPRGFWSVLARPDGSKQWAYQGYALWTYDGDRKPGDITGNDSFQYAFADTPAMVNDTQKKMIDLGTPTDGAPALYWSIAIP